MNQELFIVMAEKKFEPEIWHIVAVFDTETLAEEYRSKLHNEGNGKYQYFIMEEVLRTELP